MRILLPTAEAVPLYKIGGLGDVAGSLPQALLSLGHDARLILPKYQKMELEAGAWKVVDEFEVIFEHKLNPVKVWQGKLPGSEVVVYLLESERLPMSIFPDYQMEIDAFAFFSQAVTTWLNEVSAWQPQVVHVQDWQVSLIPLLLKQKYPENSNRYKTLLTIHNIAYKGVGRSEVVNKLGLNPRHCQALTWDMANGDVDILMEGIIHADKVNTVSPTYAQEILTPEYGMNLETILQGMQGKLSGILNGIDVDKWNPQTDQVLVKQYGLNDWKSGKLANKLAVQKEMGLEEGEDKTLIGFVGRLDPVQKGVGLILEAINSGQLNIGDLQVVLLGTGDPQLENALKEAASRLNNFSAMIKFDGKLARKIYAGSDFLLVPSKYEPCGLIQMIGMRYGTIPIVRATGGLKDTVKEEVTGFLFPDYSMESMMAAVNKALEVCKDHGKVEHIVQNCMSEDFTWEKSAKKYADLYEGLILS